MKELGEKLQPHILGRVGRRERERESERGESERKVFANENKNRVFCVTSETAN